MKSHTRRMTKRNDRTFAHTISIPAELVREFGMSGMMMQITGKNNEIHIKKIGDGTNNNNKITYNEEKEEDILI